jgi:hypothetical protein
LGLLRGQSPVLDGIVAVFELFVHRLRGPAVAHEAAAPEAAAPGADAASPVSGRVLQALAAALLGEWEEALQATREAEVRQSALSASLAPLRLYLHALALCQALRHAAFEARTALSGELAPIVAAFERQAEAAPEQLQPCRNELSAMQAWAAGDIAAALP